MATIQLFGTEWDAVVPTAAAESLTGFRDWFASDEFPEDGKICYLAGELYVEMGHERLSSDVNLKVGLARALDELTEQMDLGQFVGDGFRIVNVASDFSSEPDGCYVSAASIKAGRVEMALSKDGNDFIEIVGTPDMVLEVISPSSVRKDKTRLRKLYHEAGIPEYWLVDARKDLHKFEILRNTRRGYVAVPEMNGWLPSRTFNRKFRISRSRNAIGAWRYKLLVQPLG